jgi:hypothetical protein
MNLQKIEQLIEKYEKGETTHDEEKLLKAIFLNEDVPAPLNSYKALFSFYKSSKNENIQLPDFDEKVMASIEEDNKIIPVYYNNKKRLYLISSIAAGFLILLGLYFRYEWNDKTLKETFNDPVLAYNETKKILLKISSNLNSGVNEMKSIKVFNDGLKQLDRVSAFQTGLTQLEKVNVLDKAKEIITTKNE